MLRAILRIFTLIFLGGSLPVFADDLDNSSNEYWDASTPLEEIGLIDVRNVTTQQEHFLSVWELRLLNCMHQGMQDFGEVDLLLWLSREISEDPEQLARNISDIYVQCRPNNIIGLFSQKEIISVFIRGIGRRNYATYPAASGVSWNSALKSDDGSILSHLQGGAAPSAFDASASEFFSIWVEGGYSPIYNPVVTDYILSRAYFEGDVVTLRRMVAQGALGVAACNHKHEPVSNVSLPCFADYIRYFELKSPQLPSIISSDEIAFVAFVLRDGLINNYRYADDAKYAFIEKALIENCAYQRIFNGVDARIDTLSKILPAASRQQIFGLIGLHYRALYHENYSPEDALDQYRGVDYDLYSAIPTLRALKRYYFGGAWEEADYTSIINTEVGDQIIEDLQGNGRVSPELDDFRSLQVRIGDTVDIDHTKDEIDIATSTCSENFNRERVEEILFDNYQLFERVELLLEYGDAEQFQIANLPAQEVLQRFENAVEFWESLPIH